MKKINTYSAQFKVIYPKDHSKRNNTKGIPNEKKLSKDRQEFINNIAASGFKHFHFIINGSIRLCNL